MTRGGVPYPGSNTPKTDSTGYRFSKGFLRIIAGGTGPEEQNWHLDADVLN
jgi:hypothetical protein